MRFLARSKNSLKDGVKVSRAKETGSVRVLGLEFGERDKFHGPEIKV